MDGNGITRREFDRLADRVERMDREGSRAVQRLADRLERDEREMDDFKSQIKTLSRTLWTLTIAVIVAALALIGNLIDNVIS